MANIWFVSDTHFGHAACLYFKREDGVTPLRSFASVEDMDQTMVENWNRVVKPSDHVYHLGDVAMRREFLAIVKRLNGHKRLIFGNHDIFDYKTYVKDAGFEKMMGMRVLDGLIFTHVPIHPSSLSRFKLNVHGHMHANNVMIENPALAFIPDSEMSGGMKLRQDMRYLNVCVEQINYTPIHFEEIKAIAKRQ